jgi:hypothetical protein
MYSSPGFRIIICCLLWTQTCSGQASTWSHIDEARRIQDQIQKLDQDMYSHTRKFLQAEADHDVPNAAIEFSKANEAREEASAEEKEEKMEKWGDASDGTASSTGFSGWSLITYGTAISLIWLIANFVKRKHHEDKLSNLGTLSTLKESLLDPTQEPTMEIFVHTECEEAEVVFVSETASESVIQDSGHSPIINEPPLPAAEAPLPLKRESQPYSSVGREFTSQNALPCLDLPAAGSAEHHVQESDHDVSKEVLPALAGDSACAADHQVTEPSASEPDSDSTTQSNLADRIQAAVENLANQSQAHTTKSSEDPEEGAKTPVSAGPPSETPQSERETEPQSEPDSSVVTPYATPCAAADDRSFSKSHSTTKSYSASEAASESGSEDSEQLHDEERYGDHTDLPSAMPDVSTKGGVIANFSVWYQQFSGSFGEDIRVVGNVPALGCWNPKLAPSMQCVDGHTWVAKIELEFPPDYKWTAIDKPLEYKYVLMCRGKVVTWEECANRVLSQPRSGSSLILRNVWNVS